MPVSTLPARWKKIALLLSAPHNRAMYELLMSYWTNPSDILFTGNSPQTALNAHEDYLGHTNFINSMMYTDTCTYLPDDIMVKVDRCSMAVSLEARAPLLDYNVVSYAWCLPLHMKLQKKILKNVLARHVPRELFERPKQGFGIPHGAWLRGPLKEWASDLLSQKNLEESGIFKPAPILERWDDHCTGTRDGSYHIWNILMFQAWYKHHCAQ
ncbi:MAG: asparagine synthase C-terminal domain-containing protein [Alphaproteobacteria bacterium]|nr:asparagine synthase C-terminal domain-containing protein [Alphaproteobacteria bacterium]